MSKMDVRVAASTAEFMLSPEYSWASALAFEVQPDQAADQRQTAIELAAQANRAYPGDTQAAAWEMRRQAAVISLGGASLGAFDECINMQGGEMTPQGPTKADLILPSNEIIKTNSIILDLAEVDDDPISYLSSALDVIDARKKTKTYGDTVDNSNYATAFKFATDKYLQYPSDNLDKTQLKVLLDKVMNGFIAATDRSVPNFVTMTSIYYAISRLPKDTIDPVHTKRILGLALEQLPTYSNDIASGNNTISAVVGSLGKLDVSEHGETAATLIDLSFRKGYKFETSLNYTKALGAIANLPKTKSGNRVFASFWRHRNQLESSLDIDGCDYANRNLLTIVDNVIDDPKLSQAAKSLGQTIAMSAARKGTVMVRSGELTEESIEQLKTKVGRIRDRYIQM